jgi:hypothetical protein
MLRRGDLSIGVAEPACTVHCMFDWPEQIHTSPTSTFLIVIVFLPATTRSAGVAFAFIGFSVTDHLPAGSVTMLWVWSPKVTFTSSPASPVPHTRTSCMLLQHHAIRENRGQFDLGVQAGDGEEQTEEGKRRVSWQSVVDAGWLGQVSQMSEKCAVVRTLKAADLLFDRLQQHGHFMHAAEALLLRLLVRQTGHGGMNLHELKGDVFAGFADLGDGGGSVHGAA